MVVADTQTHAVDAAEAVWADIAPLDAVIDIETAARGAILHEGTEANVCFATSFPVGEDGAPVEVDALEGELPTSDNDGDSH